MEESENLILLIFFFTTLKILYCFYCIKINDKKYYITLNLIYLNTLNDQSNKFYS